MKDRLRPWRLAVVAAAVAVGVSQAFLFPAGRTPSSSPSSRARPIVVAAPWTPACPSAPQTVRHSTALRLSTSTDPAAAAKPIAAKRRAALEAEFRRVAGPAGEVSFEAFLGSTEVAELLKEKLLARAEVESFWQREVGLQDDPADLEGFVAVHARIDALFEDDDEDEEEFDEDEDEEDEAPAAAPAAPAAAAVPPGAMTLAAFLASPDVARYVEEDLVSVEEVKGLWATECRRGKLPAADAPLGRDGQMNVYAAIEALFEDEDEDEEEAPVPTPAPAAAQDAVPLGEDPEVWRAFAAAANGPDGRMDLGGFLRAGEMPELLREELLTQEEARRIWAGVAGGGKDATVDLAGYKKLLAAVDELFVDEDEDEDEVVEAKAPEPAPAAAAAAPAPAVAAPDSPAAARAELLALLRNVQFAGLLDPDDANVKARDEAVAALVEGMLDDEANLAVRDDLEISALEKAVEGDWELAYTTSRTMRFNRGLSGLGSSLPKAEFLGFEQRIVVNGYAFETVYTERLKTLGRPLDVVVEGAWELKDVVSIMDGEVCLIMDVLPAIIKYGFITERLETGWKGVRVLNRCELLYLDKDSLRVMKGQSNDSYFVFRRKQQ